MLSWIWFLIDRLPSWLRGAVSGVANWFMAPWRLLLWFFGVLLAAWKGLYAAFWNVTFRISQALNEAARGLWRIINVTIPKWIRTTVNSLWKTVVTWVGKLWNTIIAFVNDVIKWARQWINFLRAKADFIIKWALENFNRLINWVNRIGNRIADLVLHPEKLVAWIIDEIWRSWWKLFELFAPRIAELIFRSGIGIMLRMAGVFERIIARLF